LAALESPLTMGADGRTRTADRLITNQLLYQLSYIGLKSRIIKNFKRFLYKNSPFSEKRTAKVLLYF
jgi:hypothetical protein